MRELLEPWRCMHGARIAVAVTMLLALTACQSPGARTIPVGERTLTEERYAARSAEDAVVIMGVSGNATRWRRVDDSGYTFEMWPRFKLSWDNSYDAVLVKAGSYRLQTVVTSPDGTADIGGYAGLGNEPGQEIAGFTVGPGQVVYVGDLDTQVGTEMRTECYIDFSLTNTYGTVLIGLPKNIPYLSQKPTADLMNLTKTQLFYPGACQSN